MSKEQITRPTKWSATYSKADQETVNTAIDFLNDRQLAQAELSRLTRIPAGTISRLLSGDYPSPPTDKLQTIRQTIERFKEKEASGEMPFVSTSIYRLAESICNRARQYSNFGLLTGYVGVGKTFSLKYYVQTHSNTVLVEADPSLTPSALLTDLLELTNAVSSKRNPNNSDKFRAVVKQLSGSDTLLIIDEAETMQPKTLHYLRRMRDKAGVGIVLSGTEQLLSLIRPHHGQFDQVRSRTPFIPETIKNISLDDAELFILAGLKTSDEHLVNRLWKYSQGSARLLVEGLIPAIIDFGINKGLPLDTNLIDSVAVQALGLQRIK